MYIYIYAWDGTEVRTCLLTGNWLSENVQCEYLCPWTRIFNPAFYRLSLQTPANQKPCVKVLINNIHSNKNFDLVIDVPGALLLTWVNFNLSMDE